MWRSKWTLFFLVLAALAVRLIQIEQPFIDPWSWRQSDVAAIARNYLENGFHFGHPQIDWAGDEPGYVGTEFPILPFLAALCYQVTGVQEWVGRMEGVVLFVVTLPFFLLLVRRICGDMAAVWATFFYMLAPLSIVTSRAFIPDVPSLSLAIAGAYFFLVWIEENNRRVLIVSALLISLAFLIKITAVVIAPMLFYLAVQVESQSRDRGTSPRHGESVQRRTWLATLFMRWELWVFAAIVIIPSSIWYWHAYRISETFYPYHFFGGGGVRVMAWAWYWKIAGETVFSSLTPLLSLVALVGVFVVPQGKYRWAFHCWLASVGIFILLAGWGNRHQWYQLPLVPIAAALAGCACQWVANRLQSRRVLLALAALVVAAAFAVGSYWACLPFYQPSTAALRDLGLELKEATTPNALIVAADNGNPTIFYYAHRKGWHFIEEGLYQGPPSNSAQAIADLTRLRKRGATHMVVTSGTRWWLQYYPDFANYLATETTLVEETPEFIIYKLGPLAQ